MSSRVVDKIDPFLNKASIRGRKQKRSQGSSHYRTKGPTELTALPHLKGENASYKHAHTDVQNASNITVFFKENRTKK